MEEEDRDIYVVEYRPESDDAEPITINYWSKEEKARDWCYRTGQKGTRPGFPMKAKGHFRVYREELDSPDFMPILLAIYTGEGKPIPKMYMDKFLNGQWVPKEISTR